MYIPACASTRARTSGNSRGRPPNTRDGDGEGMLREKDLYTTTKRCLECLIKMMYTVF